MMHQGKKGLTLAGIALMAVSVLGCGRGAWYESYGIENERQLRSPESIPHLQRALKDGFCEAAEALGRMRARAGDALPDLLEQIAGDLCYQACVKAATQIDPDSPGLLGALVKSGQGGNCKAFDDIAGMGKRAGSVESELSAVVGSGECYLQAAKAVQAVSTDTSRALAAALRALKRVEVLSKSSISSISSLGSLKSQKSMLDSTYVSVLSPMIAGHGKAALPDLVKLVGHERWEVRYCAVRILAEIGDASPNVIEALKRAQGDQDEDIRQVATEALRKFRFADLARPGEKIVIAVFDVADPNGQFAKAELAQLTDYLSAQMAEIADFRVVPRDQVRSQLASQKRESFKAVFDERTQLQLGKALAARKSLATKLLRIDDRCAVTATLFDLGSETTEKATTVDTGCSMDSLFSAMKEVARKLADKPL